MTAPDFWLDHPPVWELGLTVQTANSGVMDNYDVRAVHDLFRAEHPLYERHEPVTLKPQLPGFQEMGPDSPLYRWWFSSENGEFLVQVQEDLVARNWRRQYLNPTQSHNYPGYQKTREEFSGIVDKLKAARGESGLPAPSACELLYDNFLTLVGPDGTPMRTQDVLAVVDFPLGTSRIGLNMQWMEPLPEGGMLRVGASVATVTVRDSPPTPVVRLTFSAKNEVEAWPEVFAFFDASHTVVRQKFLELTTKHAHTTWGLR